jgi:hypothetical protein
VWQQLGSARGVKGVLVRLPEGERQFHQTSRDVASRPVPTSGDSANCDQSRRATSRASASPALAARLADCVATDALQLGADFDQLTATHRTGGASCSVRYRLIGGVAFFNHARHSISTGPKGRRLLFAVKGSKHCTPSPKLKNRSKPVIYA